MISDFYGHFVPSDVSAWLQRGEIDIELPASNVVGMQ